MSDPWAEQPVRNVWGMQPAGSGESAIVCVGLAGGPLSVPECTELVAVGCAELQGLGSAPPGGAAQERLRKAGESPTETPMDSRKHPSEPPSIRDWRRPGRRMLALTGLRLPPDVIESLGDCARRAGCSRAALARDLIARGLCDLENAAAAWGDTTWEDQEEEGARLLGRESTR